MLKIEESTKDRLITTVTKQAGMTLAELLKSESRFNADDIYFAIANKDIYVDLETYLLAEPQRTRVFCDRETAKAYELLNTEIVGNSPTDPPVIELRTGNLILWDGKGQKILHAGATEITLTEENEQPVTIAKSMFEDLVGQGKIVGVKTTDTASIKEVAWQKFQKASLEDREEALRRYETVKPYLEGSPPETNAVSARTIRDWKKKYTEAQAKHGCGLIGLLSHRKSKT